MPKIYPVLPGKTICDYSGLAEFPPAFLTTTPLGNTVRTAVMNSAKPCRCLNFTVHGFESSAAECPSLEESMSAADDDLLKRRGGGVRDKSLDNACITDAMLDIRRTPLASPQRCSQSSRGAVGREAFTLPSALAQIEKSRILSAQTMCEISFCLIIQVRHEDSRTEHLVFLKEN